MHTQSVVVACLVASCGLYALWALMPALARRWVATQLHRLPLGPWFKTRMVRAASASSGCDCTGCDKPVVSQQGPTTQPIRFHIRPKG